MPFGEIIGSFLAFAFLVLLWIVTDDDKGTHRHAG